MISKRKMGKSNVEVSPIGVGVMMWSGGSGNFLGKMMTTLPDDLRNSIIKEAFEGGINFFDTAEMYGAGNSESNLVKALKANNIEDKDVVIETKWNPIFRRARNMQKTIEDRIRYLEGYSIDLFMIHNPMSFSSITTQMEEMIKLVKENKIKSVGISNFNATQMRTAFEVLEKHDIPLAANQVNYSLVKRKIEKNGVLDTAKELGVTITAYTPLGAGLLTGKYHDNPELLDKKLISLSILISAE